VIAISLTIVAVFAPVSFMGCIAGQYFRKFGLTVAVAVLYSLAVARLITPMVSAWFIRDSAGPERQDGWLMRRYQAVLRWTLDHRTVTLLLGLVIFAGSLFSATLLPTEFIPAADIGRSAVSVELPPGATLEETRQASRALTERVAAIPEVRSVFVDGGSAAITRANLSIDYGPPEDRDRDFRAIEAEIRAIVAKVPDLRLHILRQGQGRDVTVNVLGDTDAAAAQAAGLLVEDMRKVAVLRDASTSATLTRPEIRIVPKPKLAAELGVSASALATTARIATIGDSEQNLAKFDTGTRRIPIVVRLNAAARADLTTVANARVPSTRGGQVPLGVVADLRLASGPASIERYDRRFKVSVAADLAPGVPLGPGLAAVQNLPTAQAMPEGTAIQESGDAEAIGEIFSAFATAMGTGILLVYVVLVLLFSSFLTPIGVLLSLPLAIGGAIFALYLGGYAIGLSVAIGFLMLMGIVTKNAIMLVEFAHQGMERGMSPHDAMLDAGHKRARPIVMTTVAMTAGMIPSAIGGGTGAEFRAPMAVAVIGGLLLSTLLSLLFVPSLFSVVEGLKRRSRRLLARITGSNRPQRAGQHRATGD
jgi:multidrug efflux pump subunit AcrB